MRELVEERLAVDAAPAGREEDGEVEVEDVAGEWRICLVSEWWKEDEVWGRHANERVNFQMRKLSSSRSKRYSQRLRR